MINQIPSWIRHTDYCPFKSYGIAAPADVPTYFAQMKTWAKVCPLFAACVRNAFEFSKKETKGRKEFKAIMAKAPIDVIYSFGLERSKLAYQDASLRAEFLGLLYEALRGKTSRPRPTGFNEPRDAYHPNRQIFKPTVRLHGECRPNVSQIRPGSYASSRLIQGANGTLKASTINGRTSYSLATGF